MASVRGRIIDPASIDPTIFVGAEARKDPRIERVMRNGRLLYCATVNGVAVESDDILDVYDQLPG